ncbi:MAG: FUSC family protein [Acetobacteraceae bacterium]
MALADTIGPSAAFVQFLREELAPRPGRLAAVARIAGGCTVIVAIAMLYQVPLPAYMAYVVFLISRDESASALLTGVVAGLAVTLAVALSLVFYTLDASEPALRLPLMAGSAFIGMFLARTMALGPVAFLASFVVVISQTLIDEVPTLEGLTRLVLWLWVVALVPDMLTVLINLAIGENPGRLARRTTLRLLGALAAALRHGDIRQLRQHQADAAGLLELRQRAAMFEPGLRSRTAIDTALIETLAELLILLAVLPADTPPAARLPLAEACEHCAAAFEGSDAPPPPQPGEAVLASLSAVARPVVVAMAAALTRLNEGIVQRRTPANDPIVPPVKTIFVPDAFSNPGHARFALKTTIAVMAAYIIYSGLDWPGISTAITTCFFVALGSIGETVHKLTLRLSGAVIGGLIGGLCVVYVLPEMTDIGQLCILIAAVSAVGAWVATSSERLAYAGMQLAFAFFLGVLQGYGPATDLTVLRDRVVGILLGNILMSLVFSAVWPVSAVDQARSALAAVLNALGQLLTSETRSKAGPRLVVIRTLGGARRFAAIAAFERRVLPEGDRPMGGVPVNSLDRLAGAVFAVVDQEADAAIADIVRVQDEAASAWFAGCASRLSKSERPVEAPGESPTLSGISTMLSDDVPASLRAAIEARLFLRLEIAHAAGS